MDSQNARPSLRRAATRVRLPLAAALLAVFTSGPAPHAAAADAPLSIPGAEGPGGLPAEGDGVAPAAAALRAKSSQMPQRRTRLTALDVAALRAEDEAETAGLASGASPLAKRWNRVGVVRGILALRIPPRPSRWRGAETLSDGSRVFRAEFAAPGATGLRLHFAECSLPAGAEITVSDADEPSESYGPLRLPADARDHHAPTVFGERVVLALRVPAAALDERVKLTIDSVAQRYRPAEETHESVEHADAVHSHDRAGVSGGDTRAGLSCMNNVACDSSYNSDIARAVARFEFTSSGSVYLCSGTLVNDSDTATTIPYFLTAHHCVATDKVARTMEFYWDYKAPTCGGSPPSLTSVPRTSGATLVTTSENTDVTLVRITGTLPSNRYFAGWTSVTPPVGEEVVCVHHPEATHMRVSYGAISDRSTFFHTVTWSDGVTAEGSSGSAIFNSQKQILGQLCCGLSYCNRPQDPDDYGRFDVSYTNVLAASLGGGQTGATLDDFDPEDDTSAGATDLGRPGITANSEGPRVVGGADAADWFTVDLVEGAKYVFEAGGAVRADVYADAAGSGLVATDYGVGGGGFRIGMTAGFSGTHWIRIRRATTGAAVTYSLLTSQTPEDTPPGVRRLRAVVSRKKVVTLTWRDRARGELGYKVELLGPDGFVELATLSSNTVKFRHRPGPGDHTYRVGPYNSAGTTSTAVSVTVAGLPGLDDADPEDDNGAGATDLGADSFGTTGTHELDVNDIADWYRIDLQAGTTYVFGTLGSGDTVGSIHGEAGGTTELAYGDDDQGVLGRDLNFRILFSPETTGTYYIEVSAYPTAPRATYQLYWQILD